MAASEETGAWLDLGDVIASMGRDALAARPELPRSISHLPDGARAVVFSQEPDAPFPPEGYAWLGEDLDGAPSEVLALTRHLIADPASVLSLDTGGGWRSGGLRHIRRWTLLPPARTKEAVEVARLLPEVDTLAITHDLHGARTLDVAAVLEATRASRLRARGRVDTTTLSRIARSSSLVSTLRAVDLLVDAGAPTAQAWLDGGWTQLTEARFAGLRPNRATWTLAAASPSFRLLRTLELAWPGVQPDDVDAMLEALHASALTVFDLSHDLEPVVAERLVAEAPQTLSVLRVAGVRVAPASLSQRVTSGRGPGVLVVSGELYTEEERLALASRAAESAPRIFFEGVTPPALSSLPPLPVPLGTASPWWALHDDRRLPCDW